MITFLVCGYAYIVWLLTGVNPMPHISIGLIFIATFELLIELAIVILILNIIYK